MEEQHHLRDNPASRATGDAREPFIAVDHALAMLRDEFSPAPWLHRIALRRSRNRFWFNYRRPGQGTAA